MFHDNLFPIILFVLFCVASAVQLFYYLWYYLAVHLRKEKNDMPAGKPVSIIICARNEADNLKNFLPSFLEQEYPDYEVIVVNDCSEDNSYEILGNFLKIYPHLRISNVNKDPKFTHNKKFAQFIGIKAAKNEILVFTDADCRPESPQWLEGIASHFDDKTDFVLGYGGYFNKKGLLNKYIRYDCMTIAMQYLGMAIRGVPYMGVGRNLAYKRSLFLRIKASVHIIMSFQAMMIYLSIPMQMRQIQLSNSDTPAIQGRSPAPVSVNGRFKRGGILLQHLTINSATNFFLSLNRYQG